MPVFVPALMVWHVKQTDVLALHDRRGVLFALEYLSGHCLQAERVFPSP